MANKPKVLLITSTGLVGSYLYRVLKKEKLSVIGACHLFKDKSARYNIDIVNKDTLERVFAGVEPEVVILSAALANVDYCEEHKDEAWQVNVEGLQNVVERAEAYDAKLVFFSTDYIFNGENGPYTEVDRPNPICFYGETKLRGESIIKENLKDYLIIRTTVVYGCDTGEKNFAIKLINTLKEKRKLKIPFDQVSSPTYALNLAEIVTELIKKNKLGIYNVVGKDLIDRYTFALRICSEFGLSKNLIIPTKTKDLNQKAKRPLKAGLKVDKVRNEINRDIFGLGESLKIFKKELKWTN